MLTYNMYEGGPILHAMNEMLQTGKSEAKGFPFDTVYTMYYVNDEACVIYAADEDMFYAIKIGRSTMGGAYYHRSTKGNLKRAKKAFEKYSPKFMASYRK